MNPPQVTTSMLLALEGLDTNSVAASQLQQYTDINQRRVSLHVTLQLGFASGEEVRRHTYIHTDDAL